MNEILVNVRWYPVMFFTFALCMVIKIPHDRDCVNDVTSSACTDAKTVFMMLFSTQSLIFCIALIISNPDAFRRIVWSSLKKSFRTRHKKVKFTPARSNAAGDDNDSDTTGAESSDADSDFDIETEGGHHLSERRISLFMPAREILRRGIIEDDDPEESAGDDVAREGTADTGTVAPSVPYQLMAD
jgi:hypothetical protein